MHSCGSDPGICKQTSNSRACQRFATQWKLISVAHISLPLVVPSAAITAPTQGQHSVSQHAGYASGCGFMNNCTQSSSFEPRCCHRAAATFSVLNSNSFFESCSSTPLVRSLHFRQVFITVLHKLSAMVVILTFVPVPPTTALSQACQLRVSDHN